MGELVSVDVFRKKRAIYDLEKLFKGEEKIVNYEGAYIKEKFLTMYEDITFIDLIDKLEEYIDLIDEYKLNNYFDEQDMCIDLIEVLKSQLKLLQDFG